MPRHILVGGVRTPVGRYGGALSAVRPDDLAALVVKELVARTGMDPDGIDEVILGSANQAGEDNRNVARMATLLAGLPDQIPGITVNRLCASGLSAIIMATQMIKSGAADVVIAGGVESMSRAPWVHGQAGEGLRQARRGLRHLHRLALHQPAFQGQRDKATYSMPETAEEVAALDGITREDADAFALRSHGRRSPPSTPAASTTKSSPCRHPQGRAWHTDEGPRRETTLEALAGLRPVVKPGGIVHRRQRLLAQRRRLRRHRGQRGRAADASA